MMKSIIYFLTLMLFLGSGLYADEINVAVASNFKYTLQQIAADFELKSRHKLIISSASSGKLFAQIQLGAPFDVFLSADEKRVDLLVTGKKASAESVYIYALGKLVLISNTEEINDCNNVLSSKNLKHLAIANPDIAPYGLAAKQVLKKLGLWRQLQPRLVVGENIAQTFLYVSTKNADAGFVAQSMLNKAVAVDISCSWNIPGDMYSPIKQKMVLLNRAKNKQAAEEFLQYMKTDAARKIIKATGYDVL